MTIDEKAALRTEALAVLNPRVEEVIPLPAQTNRAAMTPAQIEEAHAGICGAAPEQRSQRAAGSGQPPITARKTSAGRAERQSLAKMRLCSVCSGQTSQGYDGAVCQVR